MSGSESRVAAASRRFGTIGRRLRTITLSVVMPLIQSARGEHEMVHLTASEDGKSIYVSEGGTDKRCLSELSRMELANLRNIARDKIVALALPKDSVLVKTIHLPSGLQKLPPGFIDGNISTWTPFEPSEIYFSASRRRSHGRDALELAMANRRYADDIIERASQHSISIDLLRMNGGSTSLPNDRSRSIRRAQARDLALVASAVLLVWAACGISYRRLEEQASSISAQTQILSSQLQNQNTTEAQIAAIRARLDYRTTVEQRYVPVTTVINTLAASFPPATAIEDLVWSKDGGAATVVAPSPLPAAVISAGPLTIRPDGDVSQPYRPAHFLLQPKIPGADAAR